MTNTQSLQIVYNAIKAANKAGTFEIEESASIFNALQVLNNLVMQDSQAKIRDKVPAEEQKSKVKK